MVNVSSLPTTDGQVFDLDNQKGITAVLLAVRASNLSVTQKNELRDLVFLYTSGGKDQTVRRALEQKIAAANLVPVAAPRTVSPLVTQKEQPVIGTYRSTPQFSTPAPVTVKVTSKEPVITAPVADVVPSPYTHVVTKPVPEATAKPVPEPEQIVVPPVQTPSYDQKDYLNRIREIKANVNEKVGNPVNLVDIDNTVGREYMSALLDAMKRINSGLSAEAAMVRLEAAYAAVEETLKKVPADVRSIVTNHAPTPAPVRASIATPTAPTSPVFAQSSAPVMPEESRTVVSPHTPTPVVAETPNYAHVHTAAVPAGSQSFSSLADMVKQSHAHSGLPTTPSVPSAPLTVSDPLMAPEVDAGLSQLLSEWSIFKKSGMFGTGPKGKDHPLYKAMAQLQIPMLIAGRFEGATQEVRQSLTDYMNGWRYEQGLMYEKGEVFEHYLRRVIRHIIDQHKQ